MVAQALRPNSAPRFTGPFSTVLDVTTQRDISGKWKESYFICAVLSALRPQALLCLQRIRVGRFTHILHGIVGVWALAITCAVFDATH
jgi:hypothetical protein